MHSPAAPPRVIRFGVFEFDPITGDLSRDGRRVRLQEQPRQLLGLLVARPGELVTREEIRAALWPDDTFVDVDTSVNALVNRVRQALGDSASSPRFIETFPRRGYRFVAPVLPAAESVPAAAEPMLPANPAPVSIFPDEGDVAIASDAPPGTTGKAWTRAWPILAATMLVAGIAWFARDWRRAPDSSSGSPVRTIAVLPLENLSGNSADDYFADGMTDALITDLATVRALNVIARQSTKQYKGSSKPVSTIAKELGGVDAVIEGSVLRTGNRVRLIVQLIDARTDVHLWARTHEQNLTDILQLQHDASLTVVNEIRAALTPEERARLASARQVSPAAHDAYLRGRYILERRGGFGDAARALAEFQRAIDLDGNFAPAYVGMAQAQLARSTFFGGESPAETRPTALRAARRALELDPDLGDAHGIMGRLQLSEFDWAGADRSFARMLTVAPGGGSELSWYAYHLLVQHRFAEALESIKRAATLDPLNLNLRVTAGFIHTIRREYAESIDIFEQVLALDPENLGARAFLVTSAARLGRHDKAIAAATSAVERFGRAPLTMGRLAFARAGAGERPAAERLIADLLGMRKRQYVSPGHLAFAYAALGDRDHAFEWFERAYDERSNMMLFFPVEPMFEWPDDPRYVSLVARIRAPHTVRDGS